MKRGEVLKVDCVVWLRGGEARFWADCPGQHSMLFGVMHAMHGEHRSYQAESLRHATRFEYRSKVPREPRLESLRIAMFVLVLSGFFCLSFTLNSYFSFVGVALMVCLSCS
jgi:hypothetical protein